ncbi:MAG: DUF1801 domain-containing protein, partial [Ignavibacteria bacterium]|nr:DUF1801 domain-containing protein [Ignavibacteria bacterium]
MKNSEANPKVDFYLQTGCGRCEYWNTPNCKVNSWRDILIELRKIILTTELKEELKWGQPCYTINGKNVLLMAAFRDYVALSFFKGTLLKDKNKILVAPGENSQSVRQIRFTKIDEVKNHKKIILDYIKEAIENEKKGLKVTKATNTPIPIELKQKFEQDKEFEKAFYSLTPGRQRAYLIYFNQPKNSSTKLSRIEKSIPKIFQGKGL